MEGLISLLRGIRPEIDFENAENFMQDGLLDSLDIVMLVSALDKKYNISIKGIDIVPDNFTTIENMRNLVIKSGGNIR